jgi:F-type H+-transporting ATPase subunit delta
MDSINLDVASLPGRYARSLFELGNLGENLSALQEDLHHFHNLLETVPDFKEVLLRPTLKIEEQKVILGEIAQQNKYEVIFLKFLFLLCENQRLDLLTQILHIFNDLERHTKNVKKGEVISAIALTKTQQKKLQQILTQKTKSFLNFSYRVDKKVLGGILVKIESQVIDLTLNNQINILATEMRRDA